MPNTWSSEWNEVKTHSMRKFMCNCYFKIIISREQNYFVCVANVVAATAVPHSVWFNWKSNQHNSQNTHLHELNEFFQEKVKIRWEMFFLWKIWWITRSSNLAPNSTFWKESEFRTGRKLRLLIRANLFAFFNPKILLKRIVFK